MVGNNNSFGQAIRTLQDLTNPVYKQIDIMTPFDLIQYNRTTIIHQNNTVKPCTKGQTIVLYTPTTLCSDTKGQPIQPF